MRDNQLISVQAGLGPLLAGSAPQSIAVPRPLVDVSFPSQHGALRSIAKPEKCSPSCLVCASIR